MAHFAGFTARGARPLANKVNDRIPSDDPARADIGAGCVLNSLLKLANA